MGLPELFSLRKAAQTVAAQVSAGNVALILRDAKANGVHAIYRESDIPSELGAPTPAEAVKKLLPGEIVALSNAVEQLTGYRRKTIREVKNG